MKKIFLVVLSLLCSSIICDQRNFIFTYEKKMMSPGDSELELYVISEYPKHSLMNNEGINTLKLQYELEIGMTDELEVSFYNTFIQKPGESLKFDQYKLRFKYKIFEDHLKWKPLLYSEIKGNLDFTEIILEQKFIFSEKIGKYNFSFNPIVEFEMEKSGNKWNTEFEIESTLGLSYSFSNRISTGFDMKISEYATYFGPVFSHGGEGKWWVFGLARKVSGLDEKPDLLIESIMGFDF